MLKQQLNARNLSLKQQVAQMVVVRASGTLFDSQIRYPQWEPPNQKLHDWITELQVGGIILLGGSAAELSLRIQHLQSLAKIPLLIAADIEEGVGQRFAGATEFPPPMALSGIQSRDRALELAKQMGAITAKEAKAIGINWVLAPVVDVNNNPDNPVINVRAFGETAIAVSHLAAAFIEGAKAYPVLTTAKHFPGHGDTATDSHLELPTITHGNQRLAEVEIPPFKAAIAAGVDSVMSAHLRVSAWDEKYPATLSPTILTEKLRKELGFEGLIVTDALVMGGVANFADFRETCVLAVEAGADILLMPQDPEAAVEAVCAAVESGRIPIERIHSALERIGKAKEKACSAPSEEELTVAVSSPDALETADAIARESLQFSGGFPLPPIERGETPVNLVVVDNLLNCPFLGSHTAAIAVPTRLGYKLQLIEQQSLNLDELPAGSIVQVFSRGNPFRGSIGLLPNAQTCFKNLLRIGRIRGLAIYGSPYVWEWFSNYLPHDIPGIFSYGQTPNSQTLVSQILFEGDRAGVKTVGEAFI